MLYLLFASADVTYGSGDLFTLGETMLCLDGEMDKIFKYFLQLKRKNRTTLLESKQR